MSKLPANFPQVSLWTWNEQRSRAAVLLASGNIHQAVADEVGVDKRTITNWLQNVEFAAEVDRLSLMVDVSSRAERLRIAMKAIRQSVKENQVTTDRDVLDWLKFAQSETDGVKLDLTKLTALSEDAASVAHRRQIGTSESDSPGSEPEDSPTIG
jgi:hypothetical protein